MHEKDTGSQIQIALLTEKIETLKTYKTIQKDKHSSVDY